MEKQKKLVTGNYLDFFNEVADDYILNMSDGEKKNC